MHNFKFWTINLCSAKVLPQKPLLPTKGGGGEANKRFFSISVNDVDMGNIILNELTVKYRTVQVFYL